MKKFLLPFLFVASITVNATNASISTGDDSKKTKTNDSKSDSDPIYMLFYKILGL